MSDSSTDAIVALIRQRAMEYGLDPDTMVRTGRTESGLNPNAANPNSSARGVFQFMTRPGGSWDEYGRGGNPLDANANIDAGMRYTRDNVNHLRNALGRDPTPGETYLAHQQGRAGAAALLTNPDRPAVDVISKFYRNPQTAQDAIRLNGGYSGITAGDFAARWNAKFNGEAVPVSPGSLASSSGVSAVAAGGTQMSGGDDAPATGGNSTAALLAAMQKIGGQNQQLTPHKFEFGTPPGILRARAIAKAIRDKIIAGQQPTMGDLS